MIKTVLAGALICVPVAAHAQAPVWLSSPQGVPYGPSNPLPVTGGGGGGGASVAAVTCTDRSGTIAVGGTAQNAAVFNTSRKTLIVQNASAATEPLTFSVTGVAGAGSLSLPAGGGFTWPAGTIPTAAVSVYAATTGHAFVVVECQ